MQEDFSLKEKTAKKQEKEAFLNIPKSWPYLVGYEYQAINQHGAPKLTKGQKPVLKRIDHADLLILDEIRGFSERGNKECFEEATALARAVGMIGQEKQVCDKILQLCGIGFVNVTRKIGEGKSVPKIILTVDTQLVNDVAEARKEYILEQQRIDSQQADFFTLLRENNLLQEYLQKYLQEQLPEQVQEKQQKKEQEQLSEELPEFLPEHQPAQLQEPLHEKSPEPLPGDLPEQPHGELPHVREIAREPHTEPALKSLYDDYFLLDGKTNDEISFECRKRFEALRNTLRQDWSELVDYTACKYSKGNRSIDRRQAEHINQMVYLAGACSQDDNTINNMVGCVNLLLENAQSNAEWRQCMRPAFTFSPMVWGAERKENAIDKASQAC